MARTPLAVGVYGSTTGSAQLARPLGVLTWRLHKLVHAPKVRVLGAWLGAATRNLLVTGVFFDRRTIELVFKLASDNAMNGRQSINKA